MAEPWFSKSPSKRVRKETRAVQKPRSFASSRSWAPLRRGDSFIKSSKKRTDSSRTFKPCSDLENLTQKHKGRCVNTSLENTSGSIHSIISPSRMHSVRTTGFVADTVLSFRSLPTASSQSSFLSISQDTGFHPKTSSPHTSTAGPLLHPQLLLRTPTRHYHPAMKRGGGSRGYMEWWILRKGWERMTKRMMRMER